MNTRRILAVILVAALAVSLAAPASAGVYVPDTWYAHVTVTLNQRMATRTGPGTQYDEPGSFFSAGTRVTALSRAYDPYNGIWWVQVEFTYGGAYYRAYTGAKRFSDLNLDDLPEEQVLGTVYAPARMTGYYGPTPAFKRINRAIPADPQRDVDIIAVSSEAGTDYYQIECYDPDMGCYRRAWVPREAGGMSREYFYSDYEDVYWPGDTQVPSAPQVPGVPQDNHSSSSSSVDRSWPVGTVCRVRSSSGRVRTGPGTEYEQAGYVNQGQEFEILDLQFTGSGKDWYLIRGYFGTAWVSSGIVSVWKGETRYDNGTKNRWPIQ